VIIGITEPANLPTRHVAKRRELATTLKPKLISSTADRINVGVRLISKHNKISIRKEKNTPPPSQLFERGKWT